MLGASSPWPIAFGIGGACTALAALWVSVMGNRRSAKQDYAEVLETRLTTAEEQLAAAEVRLKNCEDARARFERLYYQLLSEIYEKGQMP